MTLANTLGIAALAAAVPLLGATVLPSGAAAPRVFDAATNRFQSARRAEAIATITVRCDRCAWDVEGREAVVLRVSLDGQYSQHLPVVRTGRAEYAVALGPIEPGEHLVEVVRDRDLTAPHLRDAADVLEEIAVQQVSADSPQYVALSFAPIVHARPNTVGRFTDVPVFMWYESEPTPRGTRYRYSVIFTNEDGGTPTDRLMATWGRTTDIEYVYSVEVDPRGTVLADDLQGPEHKILAFAGKRQGRHPLLWVTTDNNMVEDRGTTSVRYAPAAIAFPLKDVSREAVMDANPWLYEVASKELLREGKIVENAPPGNGTIPDPRRFVYVEACGELGEAAVAWEVGVGDTWVPSDRGVPQYKIVRDGCFRAATPVSPSIGLSDLRGLRVVAYPRPTGDSDRTGTASVRIDRVNRMFMLDENYVPQPSVLEWKGPAAVETGTPLVINVVR